jgi:uncharacterized protein
MKEIIVLFSAGLLAGALSGFLGIGGGIIVIPALTLLLGFSQKMAQGTSLAMLLPPIGLLAAINYYKADYVDLKAAGLLIVSFIIGSYITSFFAVDLNETYLKKAFAVFLIIYAGKLLFEK